MMIFLILACTSTVDLSADKLLEIQDSPATMVQTSGDQTGEYDGG